MEGTSEHASLSASHGFFYLTLLGELLYAYITCRPEVSYAVVALSTFGSPPLPSIFPVSKISQDLLTPNMPMICAIADRLLV
jgi:hypothetical protein